MRLSGRAFATFFAISGLAILAVTNQVVPPANPYQEQMRFWLAARATGVAALALVASTVVLGILLSHPQQAQWKQARRIYPWHETLWVFVLAFVAVHIAALVLDPYAQVGLLGAFLPGLSKYRTVPVALGAISLYAVLLTGLTARYTRLLPTGVWLKLHRFSVVALAIGWTHGILAGTDSVALQPIYGGIAGAVVVSAVYRYWIVKRRVERRLQLVRSRSAIGESEEVPGARPSAAA